jgi:hypothetical protein
MRRKQHVLLEVVQHGRGDGMPPKHGTDAPALLDELCKDLPGARAGRAHVAALRFA